MVAIITLSKPYKNSVRNVTHTTRTLLVNAFQEAVNIKNYWLEFIIWNKKLFRKIQPILESDCFCDNTTRILGLVWIFSCSLFKNFKIVILFENQIKKRFLSFLFQSHKQNEILFFTTFKNVFFFWNISFLKKWYYLSWDFVYFWGNTFFCHFLVK